MAAMEISELEKSELIHLIDNRVLIVKEFLQAKYEGSKIQEAVDEIKSILLEVEDRISV